MKQAFKSIGITVLAGIILIAIYEGYQYMKTQKAEEKRKAAELAAAANPPANTPK